MSAKDQWLLRRTLVLCSIVGSCLVSGAVAGSDSAQAQQQQLNDSQKKWESKNIRDYQYTFNWGCFCPPEHNKPVIISVRNGVLASVKYADNSAPVDKSNYSRYRTIEGLFEFIQDAINKKAYKMEISYDDKLGYPTFASIDYSQLLMDEEMSFKSGGLVADPR